MIIVCPQCKKEAEKQTGHVNRARKIGAPCYCSKLCSSIARRLPVEEKKRIKAEYDKKYRAANLDKKKKQAAIYFKKDYAANPDKYKQWRQKRKHKHAEYCRRPEYKKWKSQYDEKYRAKKVYGEFDECFLLIKAIEKEYNQQEVRQINNLHNKSQKRKRSWNQKRNSMQRI